MDIDDFESQYADELDFINELENEDPFKSKVQNENKKNDAVKKNNNDHDEIVPFNEVESNSNKKKARLDLDFEELEDIDNEIETHLRNSSITITKISKNNDILGSTRRKPLNFNHLKKSKDVNLTFTNGRKSTIKMFETEDTYEKYQFSSTTSSLLERPIDILKYEISSEIIQKCKETMIQRKNNDVDTFEINNELLIKNKDENNHNLWVEKYSPKSYVDLLSDDGINRLVLTWLKSWDHVVFGKELPMTDKKQKAEANKQASKKRKRIFNQNEIELEEKLSELDDHKRPKIKVALLSGAPGLGKTTLAHIIANIAGYSVIEMNASDDRSPEAFKQNIESVTQIKGNVSDKNFKPNLLVIDEIDGASQAAVQVLVNEINENSKKAKGKEGPTLLRPIICICNDLYAPSLKQLRQIAIVFQCPPIATHRLAERLYSICELNGLSADLEALIALSDKSSQDIRSCLNTLQFLSKTTTRINAHMINQLNVGQKDYEKGIFNILGEIFYLANYKKNLTVYDLHSLSKNGAASSLLNKFSYMASLCNNCDIDRLLQALHENYLSIRTRDGNFESIIAATDWLMFTDRLNKYIREKQEYTFTNYQRYLPVLFNILFSTTTQQSKKFQYPHSYFDCITKQSKNENILKHFIADMTPVARISYNSSIKIVLDLFPYLIEIIQPNLRAVSMQLFSKNEKERLDSMIRTMILFNINYRQERCADGQYSYVFEPSFDEIMKFSGLKQRKQLCYMIKQQVAREVTTERLKMADKYKNNQQPAQVNDKISNNNNNNNNEVSKTPKKIFSSPVSLKAASILNKLKNNNVKKNIIEQKMDGPGKDTEKTKDTSDMFARYFKKTPKAAPIQTVETSETIGDDETPKSEPLIDISNCFGNDVWFKYKEGFTNAVRYNIKISKLL